MRCSSLVMTAVLLSGGVARANEDDDAAAWWKANGTAALAALRKDWKARDMPDDTTFLVHLPSGQPALPRLGSLPEGVPLQIAVISSKPSGFSVALKDCADVDKFRIKSQDLAAKQSGNGPIPGVNVASPPLGLVAAGPVFECGAGTATYDLSGADAKLLSTTRLVSRPIYSFALVTAIGFDMTILHDYNAVRSPSGLNQVARANERIGPLVLAGAQWMVGGVDYTHMAWNNYIVNPFVAVDASAPLTGFVIGDSITLTGGLSLSIGLAVHRGTRLQGASVGTTLGEDGAVPKTATWHDPRFGLYFGVTLDSNVYSALKGS